MRRASSTSPQGITHRAPLASAVTIVVVARNTSMTTATAPDRSFGSNSRGSKNTFTSRGMRGSYDRHAGATTSRQRMPDRPANRTDTLDGKSAARFII